MIQRPFQREPLTSFFKAAVLNSKWRDFNGFPCSGGREQWTLCREHVNRNTVHARSAPLTSRLSESGVCKICRSGTGIENRCFKRRNERTWRVAKYGNHTQNMYLTHPSACVRTHTQKWGSHLCCGWVSPQSWKWGWRECWTLIRWINHTSCNELDQIVAIYNILVLFTYN